MGLEVDILENGFELGVGFFDGTVVQDIIVGGSDGAAFFDLFDFTLVAGANFGGGEGA